MNPVIVTTSPEARLRALRPEDEVFLFAMYAGIREDEMALTGWTGQQTYAFLKQQFHAQDSHYRNNYPGAHLQIIEIEGEPAGRLYLHRLADEIRIMDIALLPHWRRHGIGTALLQDVLSEGFQSEKKVSIHVEMFNPALHLYERLGFRKISENGPYFLMEWKSGI